MHSYINVYLLRMNIHKSPKPEPDKILIGNEPADFELLTCVTPKGHVVPRSAGSPAANVDRVTRSIYGNVEIIDPSTAPFCEFSVIERRIL